MAAPVTVTLSTGVVLGLKPAPLWLIRKLSKSVDEPTVPMRYMPDREREEEDPNDPEYLRAVNQHYEEQRERSNNALLLLGVDILSVPEGFPPVESQEWRDELEFLGLAVNTKFPKVDWLKYYALRDATDYLQVLAGLQRLVGVREEDVSEMETSFRSVPERGTDPEPVSTNGHTHRDNVRRSSRARSGA